MALKGEMTRFKLNEISLVDKPAQAPALIVIAKRHDDDQPVMCEFIKREFSPKDRKQLASEGKALEDGSFPIVTEADLHNAISAFGRASDKGKAKAHITARAKAMGMSSALPDGWVSKADPGHNPEGDDMSVAALKKSLGLAETASEQDLATALLAKAKEAEDALAVEKSKAAKAAARAGMDADEQDYCKAMSDDDKDDFLAQSKDDRKKKMAEAKKSDETFVSNGVTISKSAVGEGPFLLMKAMAANMDTMAGTLAKAEERAANATFEKRAQEELPYVSGTVAERGAILKAVDAIADETVRKATLAQLHASNAMSKAAFSTFGKSVSQPGGGSGAQAALDKAVEDYRKSHPALTFNKAYDECLKENPGLYDAVEEERRNRVGKSRGGYDDGMD
jgi:hypothetical protein